MTRDRAALAVLVALPITTYVHRLGFYSDDWSFLALLSTAPDQSLVGLVAEQFQNPNLAARPLQSAYQALLFRSFGTQPLGYHVTNALVLIAVAWLLHAVLQASAVPRATAFSVALVYATMANYSTDRFWFAAFGYLLTIALYLAALAADLRAAGSTGRRLWLWKALSISLLAGAALGYEVVLPLLIANVVLPEMVSRRRHGQGLRRRLGLLGSSAYHLSTVAVGAGAVAYKVTSSADAGTPAEPLTHVLALVTGVVAAHLGTHGAALPYTVVWASPRAGVAGVSVGLVVAALTYRHLTRRQEEDGTRSVAPGREQWLRLALAGGLVLMLGYSVFLFSSRVGYASVGIANRVAAAGALGMALLLVALVGLVACRGRGRRREQVFGLGVAAVCASGAVVNAGLASYWASSWTIQQQVLDRLPRQVTELRPGTTVLLHNVCPYSGPRSSSSRAGTSTERCEWSAQRRSSAT